MSCFKPPSLSYCLTLPGHCRSSPFQLNRREKSQRISPPKLWKIYCSQGSDSDTAPEPPSSPEDLVDNQVQDEGTSQNSEEDNNGQYLPYWTVFGLSGAGFLETAYLTAVKLTGSPLACPTSGCDPVLQSGYSSLFGVPLSALGMLGYGAICLLSLQGALGNKYRKEGSLKDMVFFGSVALASCSVFLMYVLFTKLGGEPCLWCYSSAALSLSIFIACLRSYGWGVEWNQFPMAFMPSAGVAAATIITLSLGFQNVDESIAQDIDLPYKLPVVTEESPKGAVELAKKLSDSGVKMFGAFWCNHCYDQKQLFGREAVEYFPYVECYPDGYRKGVTIAEVCEEADVHAFPTWVFGEFRIEGDQEFEALEQALEEYNQTKLK